MVLGLISGTSVKSHITHDTQSFYEISSERAVGSVLWFLEHGPSEGTQTARHYEQSDRISASSHFWLQPRPPPTQPRRSLPPSQVLSSTKQPLWLLVPHRWTWNMRGHGSSESLFTRYQQPSPHGRMYATALPTSSVQLHVTQAEAVHQLKETRREAASAMDSRGYAEECHVIKPQGFRCV